VAAIDTNWTKIFNLDL